MNRVPASIAPCAGVTLIELLIGLAVLAIAGTLAIAGFGSLRRTASIAANVSEMVAALNLARGAARARGRPVVVCQSADGERCLRAPDQWTQHWLVVVQGDGETPGQRHEEEELLGTWRTAPHIRLRGSRAVVTYWPAPRSATTATFAFCDHRSAAGAQAVIVSQSGRPRVSRVAADGGPLDCEGPLAR